jgi:hypothetical protein
MPPKKEEKGCKVWRGESVLACVNLDLSRCGDVNINTLYRFERRALWLFAKIPIHRHKKKNGFGSCRGDLREVPSWNIKRARPLKQPFGWSSRLNAPVTSHSHAD